jgi:hypothetical protein
MLEQKLKFEKAIDNKRSKNIVKYKFTAYVIAFNKNVDEFGIFPNKEQLEEYKKMTNKFIDYMQIK